MGNVQYLSKEEVDAFLTDLDTDKDGFISYAEFEAKLDHVHDEIAPQAHSHNLHHESREDQERHDFLRNMIGTDADRISRAEFAQTVNAWRVPSLEQEKRDEQAAEKYVQSLPLARRFRAYWSVNGPETVFIALVIFLQIAFGVWQCVKYATQPKWQAAFGWGVVLSKTSAGVLYPTLFFLVLSMSRWLATFLRKFYSISRFINWDLSQEFHIKISIVALFFSSTHAIGHLTGSMLYGSRPSREPAVAALLGPDAVPRPYHVYIASLPGWTGLVAFGLFWVIALFSMPVTRRWNYEVFQLAHLLMFPMIGVLCAHGAEGLLQWPMLGYFLALPTLLVVVERSARFFLGFHRIPARLDILDSETVCITAQIPSRRYWPYKAGQYIFLQVPQISLFQWHPLTISTCIGNEMQVHIKTDGNWTSKLQNLEEETGSPLKYIGIDGPFGAPAQRFYDFDQTIVVGAGIGVTPFSGILADLQTREDRKKPPTPPMSPPSRSMGIPGNADQTAQSVQTSIIQSTGRDEKHLESNCAKRRVDFHWIVRDRNYLLWFSDILNEISRSSSAHRSDCLDIRIQTHVTKKRLNISTHIFRFLLEQHRTDSHPASPLTGLINPTHFGRPDLAQILDEHYRSMQQLVSVRKDGNEDGKMRRSRKERKVGVFFCGAPVVGYELADRCRLLTLRGREDRSLIEYHFMLEVFG